MKLLAVDDVQLIRTLVKQAIAPLKGTVIEAENGVEAIRHLQLHYQEIDLILLDWNMPKMNGIEALRAIKQDSRFQHIPVIMTTTKNERQNIIEAIQAGASHYLVKPFTAKELIKKIVDCTGITESFSYCLSNAVEETLERITKKKVTNQVVLSEKAPDILAAQEGGTLISGQFSFYGRECGAGFITLSQQSAAQIISVKTQQQMESVADTALLEATSSLFAEMLRKAANGIADVDIFTPVLIAGFITENILTLQKDRLSFTSRTFTIDEINASIKLYLFNFDTN